MRWITKCHLLYNLFSFAFFSWEKKEKGQQHCRTKGDTLKIHLYYYLSFICLIGLEVYLNIWVWRCTNLLGLNKENSIFSHRYTTVLKPISEQVLITILYKNARKRNGWYQNYKVWVSTKHFMYITLSSFRKKCF